MPRRITPGTSVDNLKREAKRWLQALRVDDPIARDRFGRVVNAPPGRPGLRQVQHALAREFGLQGWSDLVAAVADAIAVLDELGARVPAEIEARFLELACPDHHVRGASDHVRVRAAAMRLLARHQEIARASLAAAIVCGNLAEVRRRIDAEPGLAAAPLPKQSPARSAAGKSGDSDRNLPGKEWTPLLFLCFTRLPLPDVAENAVGIAKLLLDHGADPNAWFMAGDSRYTPLVGVIGEGEEDRPAHPRRDELVRLLLDRGANQYDQQAGYNIGFKGEVLWFLELIHSRAMTLGLARDWEDPSWEMLNMGNYGSGARWYLAIAIGEGNVALAQWCLARGADPDAPPPRARTRPQQSLYELAVRGGRAAIADLLLQYGAKPIPVALTPAELLLDAALRGDAAAARELVVHHPELRDDPLAIGEAVERNCADAVSMLLDAGVSPEVVNANGERPLHIAAWSNAVDVARLLIERGAEVDSVRGNYHNTALGAAVHFRLNAMVDLLSAVSRDVWELIHVGKIDRVRELIARDPALAHVRTSQQTPLMWLPVDDEYCAIELALLLLAHGADPTVVNPDGLMAADLAERAGMHELAGVLNAAPDRAV
jgi:ankyrin repeat protein